MESLKRKSIVYTQVIESEVTELLIPFYPVINAFEEIDNENQTKKFLFGLYIYKDRRRQSKSSP